MKKFLLFLLVPALWFGIHILVIIVDGLTDDLQKVDVAVILGNKVELNGEPSKRLKARLNRGVELYKKGFFKNVIVSGGVGKEGFDEALVMKNYMVKKGVPEEVIIVDSNGYNSIMTAINSKSIMDEMQLNSVMVISQYYHITRTKLAFKKVGIQQIASSHGRFFEVRDIYSLVREFFGYYKYLFIRI